MAGRINLNPHLEFILDHAGPHYGAICTTLTLNGLTEEEAIQVLNDLWTQAHNKQIQRWEQQVINDTAEEQQRVQLEQQEREVQQQVEPEAKKQNMKDFDNNTMVGNYIAPRPSQYAICCIEDFKFVELWYFTSEGCADTLQNQHTQDDGTFGLSKTDSMVTLKLVSSLKASKNVVSDTELSFWQMSMAKNVLIL